MAFNVTAFLAQVLKLLFPASTVKGGIGAMHPLFTYVAVPDGVKFTVAPSPAAFCPDWFINSERS